LQTLPPQDLRTDFPRLTYFDPHLHTAYVQSYFFGLQQQLRDNWSVEVNGLGALGRKLLVTDIVNRTFTLYGDRANSALPDISYRSGQGLSNYQALAATARYRSGRKQFQLSYTWSHSIDHQSEPLARDFFDLSATRLGGSGRRDDYAAFSREF